MTIQKATRGRGDGSIFQRGDGKWVAVLPLGVRAGKRLRRTKYATSRKDAADWLRDAQKARRQRTATEDKFTVGEQITEWLDTSAAPHVRPSTLRRYRQIVKHQLLPAIGHIPLAELTAADVRKMLLDLHRGGLSARSVSHVRAVLRVALELAVGDDKIDKNPAKYARGPSVKTVEVQYLSVEDARRLLAACPTDAPMDPAELRSVGAAERLGALYVLALVIGARQGELLGLRWQDVDLDAGILHIRHALQRVEGKMLLVEPKTEKSRRTISLAPIAVDALRAHRTRQKAERILLGSSWRGSKLGDLVFTTSIGTPLSGPRVTDLWHRFAQAHDLPQIRFHALRHSAASLHLAAGTPERVVSDLLGHSTTRLLNVYQHVAKSMQDEAAARMQAVLGEQAQ